MPWAGGGPLKWPGTPGLSSHNPGPEQCPLKCTVATPGTKSEQCPLKWPLRAPGLGSHQLAKLNPGEAPAQVATPGTKSEQCPLKWPLRGPGPFHLIPLSNRTPRSLDLLRDRQSRNWPGSLWAQGTRQIQSQIQCITYQCSIFSQGRLEFPNRAFIITNPSQLGFSKVVTKLLHYSKATALVGGI